MIEADRSLAVHQMEIRDKIEHEERLFQNRKNALESEIQDMDLELHIRFIRQKLSSSDGLPLSDRGDLRDLHILISDILTREHGFGADRINRSTASAFGSLDEIDSLRRYLNRKIQEYRNDESLDDELREAAIMDMQETVERQIQKISGAMEPE